MLGFANFPTFSCVLSVCLIEFRSETQQLTTLNPTYNSTHPQILYDQFFRLDWFPFFSVFAQPQQLGVSAPLFRPNCLELARRLPEHRTLKPGKCRPKQIPAEKQASKTDAFHHPRRRPVTNDFRDFHDTLSLGALEGTRAEELSAIPNHFRGPHPKPTRASRTSC